MSIFPLPVFEADADPRHRSAMSDEEVYARLEAPKTIVVRFGYMKLVGEFPYDGSAKPGCGSKLVARTIRGTEVCEMLTTTCSNSGCGKSISRNEMRDYIENSGGKDFPFHQKGRILRVATIEDLNAQFALEGVKAEAIRFCKAQIAELRLPMKLVDVEPILGGELMTFYYMSEDRIDFRELVQRLAGQFHTRIEMRQVAARDEARLVADYERCGQHCCCKNFLKVLKPVSMRAAKVQKATLDPLKISGRCGRLMCCLRYEDQTYKELKANLPARNKRVGTSEGPGVVVDSKILVQLVLVRLEHDMKEIAVPVEELMDPDNCPKPGESQRRGEAEEMERDALRGLSPEQVRDRTEGRQRARGGQREGRGDGRGGRESRGRRDKPPLPAAPGMAAEIPAEQLPAGRTKEQQQDAYRERSQAEEHKKKKRRRRGRKDRGEARAQGADGTAAERPAPIDGAPGGPRLEGGEGAQGQAGRKKRRRRRRRKGGGDGAPPSGGGSDGGGGAE